MDEKPVGLMTGILDDDAHYEFADLTPEELEKLQNAESQLGETRDKKTVLLAYEEKGD